jgi:hypothetical protein
MWKTNALGKNYHQVVEWIAEKCYVAVMGFIASAWTLLATWLCGIKLTEMRRFGQLERVEVTATAWRWESMATSRFYSYDNIMLWSVYSETAGAILQIDSDGNVAVVSRSDGDVLWSLADAPKALPAPTCVYDPFCRGKG